MFSEWKTLKPVHLRRVSQPAQPFEDTSDPLELRYRALAGMSAQQVIEGRFESSAAVAAGLVLVRHRAADRRARHRHSSRPPREWRPGLSVFVVHLVLAGQPAVHTAAGEVPSVLLAPPATIDQLQRQLDQATAGAAWTDIAYLFAGCHTLIDPSRAPDGQGVVMLITFAPYAIEGDPTNWERHRDAYRQALMERYAACTTGFEPGAELASFTLTPFDLEARNASYYRGSPQGGEMLPHQLGLNRPLAGYAHYRMPIAGLYQTGVATHPGAPVSAWPGRHAAAAVMHDVGIDADAFLAQLERDANPSGFTSPVVETAPVPAVGSVA